MTIAVDIDRIEQIETRQQNHFRRDQHAISTKQASAWKRKFRQFESILRQHNAMFASFFWFRLLMEKVLSWGPLCRVRMIAVPTHFTKKGNTIMNTSLISKHLGLLAGAVIPIRCIILGLLTVFIIGYNEISHAQADIIESQQIVSQYKALFNKPPKHVPSFHIVDGPITGNGDIGLTVSGPPENQRYWISKNDFWKSGPDFKQCGPSLIGGIDICIDKLKDASYHIEQILYEPVIASDFSAQDNAVNMDARVLATENIIVLEIKVDNNPVQVQLDLWAKDGYGSETGNGQNGDVFWVTREFKADNLMYPSEATIALRILKSNSNSFTLEPGKPVTIVASVMTNRESENHGALAIEKVNGLDPADIGRLKTEHNKWWQAFWAKSFIELEDKLLEKHYYASHYIMACCSRNENFPPGLYGNWITMDRLGWAGDIIFHSP